MYRYLTIFRGKNSFNFNCQLSTKIRFYRPYKFYNKNESTYSDNMFMVINISISVVTIYPVIEIYCFVHYADSIELSGNNYVQLFLLQLNNMV